MPDENGSATGEESLEEVEGVGAIVDEVFA
jgi:hypothetical protein